MTGSGKSRALAKWREIRAEIVANATEWDKRPKKPLSQITPQEAQSALDNLLANPSPPPKLSDAALAIMNRRRGE